jgi:nucleoside-diphosphate-sugar epimerase
MRVLVIGGTNFYGKRLVELLIEQGHSITIFSRGNIVPESFKARAAAPAQAAVSLKATAPVQAKAQKTTPSAEAAKATITFIKGDREQHELFPTYFKDERFDVVYDNMAMSAADVESAIKAFSGKTRHYILCSSVAVYKDWHRAKPYDEKEAELEYVSVAGEKFTPTQRWLCSYANGKRQAEQALMKANNFPFTIIRPSAIEGEGDPVKRTNYWVQRILSNETLVIPEGAVLQNIYVEDLARFAAQVVNSQPQNRVYNIASDQTITLEKYLCKIGALLGKEISFFKTKSSVVEAKLDSFPIFFDKALSVFLANAQGDFRFVATNIDQWLERVVRWCQQHGDKLATTDAGLLAERALSTQALRI